MWFAINIWHYLLLCARSECSRVDSGATVTSFFESSAVDALQGGATGVISSMTGLQVWASAFFPLPLKIFSFAVWTCCVDMWGSAAYFIDEHRASTWQAEAGERCLASTFITWYKVSSCAGNPQSARWSEGKLATLSPPRVTRFKLWCRANHFKYLLYIATIGLHRMPTAALDRFSTVLFSRQKLHCVWRLHTS
jgi:hypothetical protein